MAAKIARILAIIVGSIILLNIILFITFSIPAVQKRAADFALEKVKPIINTEASLEGIRFRLFNTLELRGIYLEDQHQDTLAYIGRLAVRIHAMDLLRNKVSVEKVSLENFAANVHRASSQDPFNFQFLIDAFAKEKDTTVVKKKAAWRITANEVILMNGRLQYNIDTVPQTPGQFNASHLDVHNLNFKGKLDFLSLEDMQADISLLSFWERYAGLALYDLKAAAKANGSQITSDKLTVTLNHSKIKVNDARYDRQSKEFYLKAGSEGVDPHDISLFTSRFAHLDKLISFETEAEGKLPQATLHKLEFQYGSDTKINLSGKISDYSNLDNSDLEADVRQLTVSQEDLQDFIRVGALIYQSPIQLLNLGDLRLQMKARGKLTNFRYDGTVDTEQGTVSLHGTGRIRDKFQQMEFEGPVYADNMKVDQIIGEEPGVGDATLSANAKVSIVADEGVTVTADGSVESVIYRGYHYQDLNFNGNYTGHYSTNNSENKVTANIQSNTERNRFDLNGDVTFGEQMRFVVKGDIERLELKPFLMMAHWKNPSVSLRIDAELAGATIDDMTGTLVADNISLVDSNFIYNPGAIYLQALADSVNGKKIQIMSSFMEAEIQGDYYFSTIGKEMKKALHHHLPSVIPMTKEEEPGQGINNFRFKVLLKNTEDISYAFSLPFYNVEQATLSGNVQMTEGGAFQLKAHIPRLMVGNNDLRETKADLQSGISTGMKFDVNTYLVQNNGFVNARLNSSASEDSVRNVFSYDLRQSNTKSNGEILVTAGFMRQTDATLGADIRIHPTTILFNDKEIRFNDATIAYRKDRITIHDFGLREKDMLLLGIDGVASRSEADNIRIFFNNTELANILAAFNVSNFAGSINGNIYIRQALDNPLIRTEELRIDQITVNNDSIGTLNIEGNWDNLYSGLDLNAYLTHKGRRNLAIQGFIPTGDNSQRSMDVNFLVDEFDLNAVQPFTASIFSQLTGRLNSNIHITGKLSEPITEGWLGIEEGVMKVAYTNVTYYVSDSIEIKKDNVGLENLVIRDQNNHTANLNVKLSHSNFGRMFYNASVRLNDFMLLNNEERTDLMVYGNLRLSGNLQVTGSPNGIFGNGNLSTQSPSEVMVMIPQTVMATEYSGVVYINTPQEDTLAFLRKKENELTEMSTQAKSGIPVVMNLTLNLNPLLKAGVLLDPTTGNALEASGEGELNVNFNSKSTPPVRLYGDYVINSGKFHYNLQNLRTIDFNIRDGSRLTMEGDPMNTQFNITAFLPVKADLAALSPTFTTELANTRVPVNALLQIRGNLEAMDLQYDIELPESSSDIQQRVNSFINNEENKILQFAYLATTGSFIPSEGSPDLNFGSSVFTRLASNTLSRGLDALFASALKDNWSVSTNLESVDGTFENVRMGLDVSTRLFNDRLRITTNLSYGDNSMLAGQQAFMGEFEMEYDINNWLMLRAFNRANERFYRRNPTTQGVGVVVTKEAKSFRNLFNFRFTKPKNEE
ncbi:MAG: translocation/assembly module TamB [Porphyromonadaceae bacterium]|nr:translocation/assembly module TamB [Porphyromonadaceae bacterium]